MQFTMSKESTYTVVPFDGAQGRTHAHTNAQKEMELEVFIARQLGGKTG